ncbi:hypothetical protein BC332_18715 [Capsicum chinense]|nr:hypothetical protein BC332_18715 [Capsicum chinense]
MKMMPQGQVAGSPVEAELVEKENTKRGKRGGATVWSNEEKKRWREEEGRFDTFMIIISVIDVILAECNLMTVLPNYDITYMAATVGGSNIDLSAWENKNNPSESRFPAHLNNLEHAVNLAKRENLPGAENLTPLENLELILREDIQKIRDSILKSPAQRAIVPASGFSFSSQQIWKIIKENKDLDLPAHKVMVATVCYEEIANEKYVSFTEN